MATVNPEFSSVQAQAQTITRTVWSGIVTGDTIVSLGVPGQAAVAGCVQFGGTFGGATVKLQVSNDNVTFFDMKDLSGTTISGTSASFFEFTSAGVYFKPVVTGGSGNSINVTMVLRG